jgi:hypothetical protein
MRASKFGINKYFDTSVPSVVLGMVTQRAMQRPNLKTGTGRFNLGCSVKTASEYG